MADRVTIGVSTPRKTKRTRKFREPPRKEKKPVDDGAPIGSTGNAAKESVLHLRFPVDIGRFLKTADALSSSLSAVESVSKTLPERKTLIVQLADLLGQAPLPPSLFVYGHSACGKTEAVRCLIKALGILMAWIDGRECYAADVMYQLALQRIGLAISSDTEHSSRCDDADEFVRQVRNLVQADSKPVVLVVDQAEQLCRCTSPGPLPVLLGLSDLASRPITTIFISSLPWEDSKPAIHLSTPIQIYFPPYTQAELVNILSRDCVDSCHQEPFDAFVKLFSSTMRSHCTNLRDLRCLVRQIFPKFVEPVTTNEVSAANIHLLWQKVQPFMRHTLRDYFNPIRTGTGKTATFGGEFSRFSSGKVLELARHSKFLLIAAFLASYNSSSADAQLFSKSGTRLSKRQRHAAKKKVKEDDNRLAEGPQSFPLHRLMAIFHSICEECLAPSAHLFSQVSSLVSLRLLSSESDSDMLDDPSYMCIASHDVVQAIARTVDFDMSVYMPLS